MSITGAIVLFATTWFLVFFMVLPVRFVSQGDAGEVTPGTPAGAPAGHVVARKAKITTFIAFGVWAFMCAVVLSGVITVRDVLEAITGEFTAPTDEDAWAVRREDGSWLFDGLIPVPELKDRLDLKELPDEDRGRYNTLAGMTMLLLGRLPRTADVAEWGGWRFEIVDLDGKRVDKVLATRIDAAALPPSTPSTVPHGDPP